ncbi:aspartate kinase [Caldibacillus thermolactis]|jgi:aspartate kinase|uniref:Aspartokinase n=1 Tax=Pallidibacillus thermolactis TaxID=251051 RepID=A0ABT2WBJ0_9BACI|nr:aspartate kinase [Pallidibacillus thermolactis]MCU9593038.1 aspartate kinase [Pallidibacillus thermolactis]MCU9600704.1 aspartate kinase [Pallidibacillus thermolactis subsp. kokeshiiformis]MED1672060.1 aspartate kinase [Pallidibacillus thermolactis subsp. kokeshiiformis]
MNKIIVQKFGGTSVRTEENRKHALQHIKKAISSGYKTVIVVSAMGRMGDPYATDTLLSLVDGEKTKIDKREQDLLMSCGEIISSVVFTNMLLHNDIKAAAFTGAQAGFITNDDFTNAKILEIDPNRILKELENLDAVVVAGFQGATVKGDITTLGRGGSDTTAAALGAALKAEWIDIFTDVEGVMTADPRVTNKARPLSVVTYNEISNLAYQGAKVIHPRAVEIAMQADVPIHVRSTYSDAPGTLVTKLSRIQQGMDIKERLVTGIAHVSDVTQINVEAKQGQMNMQEEVFRAMANEQISVDFINISPNNVVYTVKDQLAEKAEKILLDKGYNPVLERNCAKVSVVGAGITGVPGVASKIVSALSEQGIRILQSADSYTTIWVLIKKDDLEKAVNALHDAFQLEDVEKDAFSIDEHSSFKTT